MEVAAKLLICNLIDRHVLWWQPQRQGATEGRDPLCGKPGWITLTDIRAFPLSAKPWPTPCDAGSRAAELEARLDRTSRKAKRQSLSPWYQKTLHPTRPAPHRPTRS